MRQGWIWRAPASTTASHSAGTLTAKRLLMVEDHGVFAGGLEVVLRSTWRFEDVDVAHTVQEGRRLFPGGNFDAAVVDLALLDGDGASLVRELKMHRPQMPVLALGALPDLSSALDAGADAIVDKGESLEAILDALDRLTEAQNSD